MSAPAPPTSPPTLASAILQGDADALTGLRHTPLPLLPSRLVPRPWGGDRLASYTGLDAPEDERVGEAFLVAAWPDDPEALRNPSLVQLPDGSLLPLPALFAAAGLELLGDGHLERHGPRWPLLPKLLDVGTLLSVQAHPPGQPEVYLVIEADPGATIALGFRQGMDRELLRARLHRARAIQDRLAGLLAAGRDESTLQPALAPWLAEPGRRVDTLLSALEPLLEPGAIDAALADELTELRRVHSGLLDAMHHLPVHPGMVVYNRQLAVPAAGELPSADVHALGNPGGKRVLLLEVRLPGGTLRAWDHARFPRRRLDLDAAIDALPLQPVPAGVYGLEPQPRRRGVARSMACALFALDHLEPTLGRGVHLPALPGASTLHALRGQAQLYDMDGGLLARLEHGGSLLIPAGLETTIAALGPDPEILHVTLPPPHDRDAAAGSTDTQPDGRKPVRLTFGTSGLRGLVVDMTDREVYLNTAGFVRFLEAQGELPPGAPLAIGEDLRARCTASSLESSPRIARAVAKACADAGHPVIHCGRLPTPALAYWASIDAPQRGKAPMPAVMITGSHIPSDRNGVKFYKLRGEVLKSDEPAILAAVTAAREAHAALEDDPFDADGWLRVPAPSVPVTPAAKDAYLTRYLDAFGRDRPLDGCRLVLFEHSAVGRDLIAELLESLGAELVRTGRTDGFVAIDTEDLGPEPLARFAALVREHDASALISTDGDSDRPLLIDEQGRFHRGDLLGLVTALQLGVREAAVPVSTNDAVDLHAAALAAAGEPGLAITKTRIGSPWVIAAMQAAEAGGGGPIAGWEANGGFLLGSDLPMGAGTLKALPTRDAVLPLLAVLVGAARAGVPVSALFDALPARAATAALIDGVPPERSRAVIASLIPQGEPDHTAIADAFAPLDGLGAVAWSDTTDGLRVGFASGEILHLRPSGNAPQLRCYAVADSRERAETLLDGALRGEESVVRALLDRIAP